MVQVQVTYDGSLRCRATHGPSGASVLTDAPVDNHGKGESFSPTDLVATALGACMMTIMGIQAEKHGWDLVGSTVQVEKGMAADPERRIGSLTVVIRIAAELDEKGRTILERAALHCPVHKSLRPEVDIPVRFEWGAASVSD
ncbi:MAG: OsmC family protein [Planctomycetota bacterium]